MQTRIQRVHPVEFITFINTCQHDDSNDRNTDDISVITAEVRISSNKPKCHRSTKNESSTGVLSSISLDKVTRPRSHSNDANDVDDIRTSVPATRWTHKYRRRSIDMPLCESTVERSTDTANTLSSVSQHSSYYSKWLQRNKTRLSSTELQYYSQKCPSLKGCIVQSTNHSSACSKLSSSYRNHHRVVSLMQSTMEAVGEIICYNIVLYMVYLLFMFYKYSLIIAIQSSATLFSNG